MLIGPGRSRAHLCGLTDGGVGKEQLTPPQMGNAVVGLPYSKCPLRRELGVERAEGGAVLSSSEWNSLGCLE